MDTSSDKLPTVPNRELIRGPARVKRMTANGPVFIVDGERRFVMMRHADFERLAEQADDSPSDQKTPET